MKLWIPILFAILMLSTNVTKAGGSSSDVNAITYTTAVKLLTEKYYEKYGKEFVEDSNVKTNIDTLTKSKVVVEPIDAFSNLAIFINGATKTDISKLPDYKTIISVIEALDISAFKRQDKQTESPKYSSPSNTFVVNNIETTGENKGGGAGVSLPIEARIINAAADLIIDRLQQELALQFFKTFKTDLEDATLKQLLPRTNQFLHAIVDKKLLMPSLGGTWKSVFEEDLKNLPMNAAEYLRIKYDIDMDDSKFADRIRVFYRALETYNLIKSGAYPADIIHHFRILSEDINLHSSKGYSELQETVRLFDVISQNLIDPSTGKWVTTDILATLREPKLLKLFIQKLLDDDAGKDKIFSDIFRNKLNEILPQLQPLVSEFSMLAGAVNGHITKIQEKLNKGLTVLPEDYFSYVKTTFDVIKFGHKLYLLGQTSSVLHISKKNFEEFLIPIGEHSGEMISAIHTKNYGAALSEFLVILTTIRNGNSNDLISDKIITKLIKYTSFMNDVINAKSVEETKQALQSVALPAGSYSLKRNSCFSMNLTAYPGISYGGEQIKDSLTSKFGNETNYLGFSAPIGIDFTFGFKSSISLFLGLADLGTLITYRFSGQGDSIASHPVVGLRQVFAPSFAFMIGLGNTPITIGGGVQLAPKLREITTAGGAVERERDAFRYFITVSVDLPFFNFYASPLED